jgi:lysyl-tRNA synthetase class 2
MMAQVRSFFAERDVLEVDCPALSPYASIDLHIDVMKVDTGSGPGFLHTSPEYGMKRLLAQGSGDIYQLSHVFRAREMGPLHNPEFTMLEWYRLGFSFEEMIEETLSLCLLFLGDLPTRQMSYQELIHHATGLDYASITPADLHVRGIETGPDWTQDTLLQALVGFFIEPTLGSDHLFVVTHFPASQAALSQTCQQDGREVALRFEIYHRGVELANGYQELTDAAEQRRRLLASNAQRVLAGKESLPLDEPFLAALEQGLPPCCGVAVGFDRLLQLRHHLPSLHSILPLPENPFLI